MMFIEFSFYKQKKWQTGNGKKTRWTAAGKWPLNVYVTIWYGRELRTCQGMHFHRIWYRSEDLHKGLKLLLIIDKCDKSDCTLTFKLDEFAETWRRRHVSLIFCTECFHPTAFLDHLTDLTRKPRHRTRKWYKTCGMARPCGLEMLKIEKMKGGIPSVSRSEAMSEIQGGGEQPGYLAI